MEPRHDGGVRLDDRDRLPVDLSKCRSQDLVALHDGVEGGLERPHVQRAANAPRRVVVVGHVTG